MTLFADTTKPQVSATGEEVTLDLKIKFKVYREGGQPAPTLKPEGKEATFAFAALSGEHADIVAHACGLPTGKGWKLGGITLRLPASGLTDEGRGQALARGKAKMAAQAETEAKRKGASTIK